jgi:murein DD-endopeptidase MepM/ murein hydrolase activator NlpD
MLLLMVSPSFSWPQSDPATEWDSLYPMIRDGLIPKEEAQRRLRKLETALKERVTKKPLPRQDDRLCFPLDGYDFHSIGGKNGSGYQVGGYDFFDGSQHKGHPGHDIFVRDKNQDGLDDATGRPVRVTAVSPGVVVSVHENWEPPSMIRGGNYVWIYDPVRSRYYYYAHLDRISVKVGQVVSRGEGLGTVGRTGLNAYPKRSPTHLHLTVHESIAGYPRPINLYRELTKGCPP